MPINYPEHKLFYRPPLSYIDIGRVVYNGRYADIYNYARDEYMRDIGFSYSSFNIKHEKHLAVVESNIKFSKPVFYDEETTIVSKVEKIGTRSIIFNQKIYTKEMKVVANESKVIMVCIDKRCKAASIPEALKKAFEKGPFKN